MKNFLISALFAAALAGGQMEGNFTKESKISDVVRDAAFGDYGRLLFPTDSRYFSGERLAELMIKYKLGVQVRQNIEIYDIDGDFSRIKFNGKI